MQLYDGENTVSEAEQPNFVYDLFGTPAVDMALQFLGIVQKKLNLD
jgi:hypothetical protein